MTVEDWSRGRLNNTVMFSVSIVVLVLALIFIRWGVWFLLPSALVAVLLVVMPLRGAVLRWYDANLD